MPPPYFLITIDTEGDNLWGTKLKVATRNATYLERFQILCEQFGFKPCYLTSYEMAIDPVFQAFGREVLTRKTAEIGMHLHAWNSPPLYPPIDNHPIDKPYLIEYPQPVMRAKVDWMTKLLQDTFNVKPISHRAGRWAFNSQYAHLLMEYGYQVDCSVTPYVDWSTTKGKQDGSGGTDYRGFPQEAYFLNLDQIDQSGDSNLLEVPMTTRPKYPNWLHTLQHTAARVRNKPRPRAMRWLRPRANNVHDMINLAEQVRHQGSDYVQFMLHSSELMPGGSPTFGSDAAIEMLYQDMEELFQHLSYHFNSVTLASYYDYAVAQSPHSLTAKLDK